MAPILKYSASSRTFGLMHSFELREEAAKAGFTWDERGFWKTESPFTAMPFSRLADPSARAAFAPLLRAVEESKAVNSIVPIPAPEGCEYMPFQKAGIMYAVRRPHCMLGDHPGLGKSIQAIGVANYLGLKRLLVICPAGLRLNWAREIERWHLHNPGVDILLSGKSKAGSKASVVSSYDLAASWTGPKTTFDLVIVDEVHYVKNMKTGRTQRVLGRKGTPGLIHLAPRKLVLSGTPIPNRVNEIFPVLRAIAPHVIDAMNYRAFLRYYGVSIPGAFGGDQLVGIRHEEELYMRMRAGFMVRRLKKDVLKDLPEKTYKMVIFPKDGTTTKVLKRERQFSAAEIIKHGVPVGTALPEIRREMGVAKAPTVLKYVEDMLEDGVQKVIVFAHHRDVVSILEEGLEQYHPVVVSGATSATAGQAAVDAFQNDPAIRVFIGNIIAAGTGKTLTAARDVVFAEASWVPGENEQAEDRAHRIGQMRGVLIHILVVEGSLDAQILGTAARKRKDISAVLDGGVNES